MRSDSGSLLDIGGVECGLIGRKELGACSLDIPYGRLWVQSNADGLGDRVIERLVHCGALVTKDVPVTVGAHLPDRLTEVGAYVHSGNVIRGEVGVLRDLFQASLEGGALGVEFLGGGRWVSGQQDGLGDFETEFDVGGADLVLESGGSSVNGVNSGGDQLDPRHDRRRVVERDPPMGKGLDEATQVEGSLEKISDLVRVVRTGDGFLY